MKTNHKRQSVQGWVVEEELPPSPILKVIRINDPNFGLSDDEIQDRNEFISCHLRRNFEPVMMLPRINRDDDFFIPEFDVEDPEYTAFNTHDFQDTRKPFNKYGYAMRKIMGRVEDLAIMHSVISSPEGRTNIYHRYISLLEVEFRSHIMDLVEQYRRTNNPVVRSTLKKRIGELNRRTIEAKMVWEQNAPWDT